jgi:Fur family peroxide stress response transcriptional regulator
MSQLDAISRTLRSRGLKVTPQRHAIYRELLGRHDHPSVECLRADLGQQGPAAAQATIYAALRALCDAGLVREVNLDGGVTRYDALTTPHHHFHCRRCGAIEDVPRQALGPLSTEGLSPELRLESYEVTLRGVCGGCRGTET